MPGSRVLWQGGTLWHSQKDASTSETTLPWTPTSWAVPPNHSCNTPPTGHCSKAERIWQRWSGKWKPFVGCVWTRQEEALAVCSEGLQYGWTCFVDSKEKQVLPHILPDPSYGATWHVFSFLPFPWHCSWLTPGTESSCWYVATFRDQFGTHMGFSTISVNVLLALPFCSFLFTCLHFLRFLWAARNLSFCIRISLMKSALPGQETDWLLQLADSRMPASPHSQVTPPHPGSSTGTATAPELVESKTPKGSQEVLNILPLPADGEAFLWRGRLFPCALGACAPAGMMGCDRVSPGRELGAWCRVQSSLQTWREPRATNKAAPLGKALLRRRPFCHSSPSSFLIIYEESQEL